MLSLNVIQLFNNVFFADSFFSFYFSIAGQNFFNHSCVRCQNAPNTFKSILYVLLKTINILQFIKYLKVWNFLYFEFYSYMTDPCKGYKKNKCCVLIYIWNFFCHYHRITLNEASTGRRRSYFHVTVYFWILVNSIWTRRECAEVTACC